MGRNPGAGSPGSASSMFRVRISIGRKEVRTRNGPAAPAEGVNANRKAMKKARRCTGSASFLDATVWNILYPQGFRNFVATTFSPIHASNGAGSGRIHRGEMTMRGSIRVLWFADHERRAPGQREGGGGDTLPL